MRIVGAFVLLSIPVLFLLPSRVQAQDAQTCYSMAQIWRMAKCKNFDDKVFYTFEELINHDPRQYPADMACNHSNITQEMINFAKNTSFTGVDRVESRLNYLTGGNCDLTVLTGITVHVREGEGINMNFTTYNDGLCTNPGCSYFRGGCQ